MYQTESFCVFSNLGIKSEYNIKSVSIQNNFAYQR